jgi:molecular chaperone HscB
MEMMEVNESLMDLQFDPDPAIADRTTARISDLEQELNTELVEYTTSFDRADTDQKENLLLKIKDIYYRQKYLLRIHNSLNKFASR